jgi:hypothetical protein
MTHDTKKLRVLFILKMRTPGQYGTWSYSNGKPLPSGLSISAEEVSKALSSVRIENKIVQVVDNNSIDREVSLYKPTHVIIEAFWVVPDKFDVLRKLHPNVIWVIRNHSKLPFLSAEGGMIGWAIDYMNKGLIVASNSKRAARDLKILAENAYDNPGFSEFLPNYYACRDPLIPKWKIVLFRLITKFHIPYGKSFPTKADVHIGCFGAIRPLKNTLIQAVAALTFAENYDLNLKFYINATRIEGKAESNLNSIRALFKRFPYAELIEIEWKEHEDFLQVIRGMDMVVQVSNSETFNIVAADSVNQDVPVIVSNEIPWVNKRYHADPNDVLSIANKMGFVWENSKSHFISQDQLIGLRHYVYNSLKTWVRFLKKK